LKFQQTTSADLLVIGKETSLLHSMTLSGFFVTFEGQLALWM